MVFLTSMQNVRIIVCTIDSIVLIFVVELLIMNVEQSVAGGVQWANKRKWTLLHVNMYGTQKGNHGKCAYAALTFLNCFVDQALYSYVIFRYCIIIIVYAHWNYSVQCVLFVWKKETNNEQVEKRYRKNHVYFGCICLYNSDKQINSIQLCCVVWASQC